MTVQRVKNAGTAVRDASRVARDKVARDLQDVGRLADSAVTSVKNNIPGPNMVAAGNVGRMNIPSQNTHFFENKAKEMFSRADGVSVEGSVKGANDNYFIGKLKGENIHLKGVKVEEIVYNKRLPEETAKLRREFNSSIRKNFLKEFANDPVRVKYLREAGLGDNDIARMKDGLNPKGWQVHHNLPLDDGGTNDFSNLVLIKNDPYHKAVTNEQISLTRGLVPNQSRTINWPIFEVDVYPPRPF